MRARRSREKRGGRSRSEMQPSLGLHVVSILEVNHALSVCELGIS